MSEQTKILAANVVQTIKDTPGIFESLRREFESLFAVIVVKNAKEVLSLKTEDEFYDFMATVIDTLLVLPQPLETIDGPIIRMILKKVADPILDKYAGVTWYDKFSKWVLDKIGNKQ